MFALFMPIFIATSIEKIRSKSWGVRFLAIGIVIFPITLLGLSIYGNYLIYIDLYDDEDSDLSSDNDVRQEGVVNLSVSVDMTEMVQQDVNINNDDTEDIPDDNAEELDDESRADDSANRNSAAFSEYSIGEDTSNDVDRSGAIDTEDIETDINVRVDVLINMIASLVSNTNNEILTRQYGHYEFSGQYKTFHLTQKSDEDLEYVLCVICLDQVGLHDQGRRRGGLGG